MPRSAADRGAAPTRTQVHSAAQGRPYAAGSAYHGAAGSRQTPGQMGVVNARARAAQMNADSAWYDSPEYYSQDYENPYTVRTNAQAKRRSGRGMPVLLGVVLVLLFACVLVAGLACWQLWFRYDDAADIQGVWITSEGATLTVGEEHMSALGNIEFDYALDERRKVVTFSQGDAQGSANYRFSPDRTQLVLDEKHESPILVLLGLMPDSALSGKAGEGVTVLTRLEDEDEGKASGKNDDAAFEKSEDAKADNDAEGESADKDAEPDEAEDSGDADDTGDADGDAEE